MKAAAQLVTEGMSIKSAAQISGINRIISTLSGIWKEVWLCTYC